MLGDLAAHSILHQQGLKGEIVANEPLHHGHIKVIVFFEAVGVHLGAQLLVVPNQNKVLEARRQSSNQVSLQHLGSLFHNDNGWCHLLKQPTMDAGSGDGHADDFSTLQYASFPMGCQLVPRLNQTV